MNAFDLLQTLFADDLSALEHMRRRGLFVLPMSKAIKEEHLGRCCYLAEEFLAPSDLCQLKSTLGLDERRWKRYKARVAGQ
jgi:hypothetical protein